jgi:alpha-amylase
MNTLNPQPDKYVNLYFQVHQPRRLKKFQFADIGSECSIFNDKLNAAIIKRTAEDCYLRANRLLMQLIYKYPQVKCTFSISGSTIDQLNEYAPQVITSFRELAATGSVEFLAETYFHSLSYFIDRDEFTNQVNGHRRKINDLFGQQPGIFRNTDLIYSDAIGKTISDMGFDGVYFDGAVGALKGQTCNNLYRHPDKNLILFPRNYNLSDAIAFGYSETFSPEKFVSLVRSSARGRFAGIGIGYETFGEHKKASSGIFSFLEGVVSLLAKSDDLDLITLQQAGRILPAKDVLSVEKITSWADQEKDLSAWLGNELQKMAFESLKKLYHVVRSTGNSRLLASYRYLQTSDHFYYMSTKGGRDQEVHDSANHYGSPYEAFRNYMNILSSFELTIKNYRLRKHELVSQVV